jgi:uncharacterized Tic20 family protein
MFAERVHPSHVRRHRFALVALVACSAWLLLQNSLLLVWLSSRHLEPVFVVARALARVGFHLAACFWMLPAAVVLGVALALTGGEHRPDENPEISHVR